jgi:hypothetical protein
MSKEEESKIPVVLYHCKTSSASPASFVVVIVIVNLVMVVLVVHGIYL